jgi:hypothetical protein
MDMILPPVQDFLSTPDQIFLTFFEQPLEEDTLDQ